MSQIAAEVLGQDAGTGDHTGSSIDPTTSSFSFGADTHKAAMAMLDGTPATEQAQEPAQAATSISPEPVTNTETATQAQLAQLQDTDLVTVPVNGQDVTMPWSEARSGIMRQADYTRKTQAFQQERTSFEAERSGYATDREHKAALVGLLTDEQKMVEFLQAKYPHLLQGAQAAAQQAAGVADPDDIATVGQVEQATKAYTASVSQMVEELKADLQKEVANVSRTIEDNQATAKLSNEINSTVSALFKEHPYINKVIPNATDMLRYQVSLMQPQTAAEAVEAFKTVFGGWVENYNDAVQASNKTSVIAKHKLSQNNIQPPGGATVQPQPASFKGADGKVDWNKVRQNALNMLG